MRFLHNLYKFLILIVLSSGAASYAIAADTYTLKIVLGTGNCNGSTHTINNLTPGQTVYLDNYFENRDITWPPVCANHYYAGCEDNATGKSHPINLIENFPDRNMTCNAIWRPTLSCSAGTYMPSTDTGTSQCQSCRAGYYCPGIQNVSPEMAEQGITPCPIGSYNNQTGKLTCKLCDVGKTNTSIGQTSCNGSCANNSNVTTWETPYWDNATNQPKNVCTIKSCDAGYHISNNKCVGNTYYVTYNKNAPQSPGNYTNTVSGTVSNSTHTYGDYSALTINTYQLTGYNFNGWNTKADGSGTSYTDEYVVSDLTTAQNGTVTLYAQWVPKTFTLTIKNGTCNADGVITLNPTYDKEFTWQPICSRYLFLGCIDDEKGTYKIQQGGLSGIYRGSSNFTCTAEMEPIPVTCDPGEYLVSRDDLDASNSDDDGCRTCLGNGHFCPGITAQVGGDSQGLKPCHIGSYNNTTGQSECTICPNGYKTQRTQSTTKNSCQEPCENNTDKVSTWETPQFYSSNILYLCKIKECITGYHDEDINNGTVPNQCVANTYSVTYKPNKPSNASNNISGTTSNTTCTYDTQCALAANAYTLTGWDFMYWNENADGKGRSYTDKVINLTTTDGGTVSLYAQWKPKETSLSFDKNATDAIAGTPESYTAKYDYAMPRANITLPTRKGYTFKGYFDAAEEGTQYYNADGTSARRWNKTDESFTLYAQWEQCEAGYYCQGDNSKLSCPTAFTSDGGADDITDCYLNPEIKLIDEFNKDEPDLKLEDLIESGTEIHWQGTTPAT